MSTKQELDATEEWDGDVLPGSAPERYRPSIMAHSRETILAEAAALEAVQQARTSEEMYRASRLLVHIERDLDHHKAQLEQAKKLVALRPHSEEALLLLRAAEGEAQASMDRRPKSGASKPGTPRRRLAPSRSPINGGRR